jgi:tetrahydromethanopterin S-methyltransferase subunit H
VLKAAICAKLELDNSAINYQTFWHWLSRYRAKRLKVNDSSEKQSMFVQNKAGEDWQNFHPTNPIKENSQRPPPLSLHPVHYGADTDDE